jgi:flagellar hook-basal body complex protein FliE
MGNSRAIEILQKKTQRKNKNFPDKECKDIFPIKEWTINEFIAYHYKDIEGNNIFHHCYNPLTGIRELLAPQAKTEEAKVICKILKKDLMYYMSEANAMRAIKNYKEIKEKMVAYIPWEPTDIILGYEIIEVDDSPPNRGKKRQKNGSGSHLKKNKSYTAAAAGLTQRNYPENQPPAPTAGNNFHPSINGVIAPMNHQENKSTEQQMEVVKLKEELQQVISAMKKSQSRFEKSMEEKQDKYEAKLDKVTKSMQNDLTIANKKITKIHDAIRTHVTKEFIEARLTANTNGLIAWLQQNVACRPQPQSVKEEP